MIIQDAIGIIENYKKPLPTEIALRANPLIDDVDRVWESIVAEAWVRVKLAALQWSLANETQIQSEE